MSLWPDLAFGLMLLLFLWASLILGLWPRMLTLGRTETYFILLSLIHILILVFVKRLLVLPSVLLSLPEAYGTGIGDVPCNLLLALPLLHVTLDSFEA